MAAVDLLGDPQEWKHVRQLLLSDDRWYSVEEDSLQVKLNIVIFKEKTNTSRHLLWVVKVSKDDVKAVRYDQDEVLY